MPSLAAGGKIGVISNLLALAFVAGLLPYYMGKTFLEPLSLVAFAALSVFLVASLITRSFAGKEALLDLRELAAGGTSGEAMALGKAAAATLRGWSFAIAMVLVGLIKPSTWLIGRGAHYCGPVPFRATFWRSALLPHGSSRLRAP
jgi:hypothetical protein